MTPKAILFLINIIGGIMVIGSYVYGIKTHSQGVNILWGNMPQGLRYFSSVFMLLAAIGYFLFTLYILFRIDPISLKIGNIFDFKIFYLIYSLILVPSAFWMPLTYRVTEQPDGGLWLLIRIILIIVGLASLSLVFALLTLNPKETGIFYWLAVTGAVAFFIQTGINDAIIWAKYFH